MNIPELEGQAFDRVDGSAAPGSWTFRFGDGSSIVLGGNWRLVADGHVALAAGDHWQLFGHQEPVDGVREATRLLEGKRVVSASIKELGDVALVFEGAVRLDTFTDSSGYESCTIHLSGGRQLVVVGGGGVEEL